MKNKIFILLLISMSIYGQKNTTAASFEDYRSTLKAVNNVFLKKLFVKNYLNNPNYTIETDLSKENLTTDFKKANLLLKSMQLSVTGDSLDICKKVLEFNENYLKLYEIKNENNLKVKYNNEKVIKHIEEIENLPKLDSISQLNKTKFQIKNLLSNYEFKTTELKKKLENQTAKNIDKENPYYKAFFTDLEKEYKDYPFLVRVIQETKTGKETFKTELDIPKPVVAAPVEVTPPKTETIPAKSTSTNQPKTVKQLEEELAKAKIAEKEAEQKKEEGKKEKEVKKE